MKITSKNYRKLSKGTYISHGGTCDIVLTSNYRANYGDYEYNEVVYDDDKEEWEVVDSGYLLKEDLLGDETF